MEFAMVLACALTSGARLPSVLFIEQQRPPRLGDSIALSTNTHHITQSRTG
jgi:hypothetical protein